MTAVAEAPNTNGTGTTVNPGKTTASRSAPERVLSTESLEAELREMLSGEPETETHEGTESNEAKPGEESSPGEGSEAEGRPSLPEEAVEGEPDEGDGTEAESESEVVDAERKVWPESAQRRVDKLTAQKGELRDELTNIQSEKDALQERVAELEASLEERGPESGIPSAPEIAGQPLGFIETPKKLQEFVTAAKQNVRMIEDYLDEALDSSKLPALTNYAKANGAFDEATGQFDVAKLKQMKRWAQDALTEHAPARLQHLRAEAEMSAQAEKSFPFLKDTKSAGYKAFREVVQTLPEMRRLPNWKAVAAIFVLGLSKLNAENGTAPKGGVPGKAAVKPAPSSKLPGKTTVLPQRASNNNEGIDELRNRAFKQGDPKAMEELLKRQLAGVSG
jgi:hypothetical protein